MTYHVLLVEDEGLIRLTLAETLEDAGYAVTEAVNGDEARILLDAANQFDLLLTDIQMPGSADGVDLAKDFHQRHPNSPVIYMTGRPDMLARVGTLSCSEALLRKPFGPTQMLDALKTLLANRH
jgi:DNA-binding NtrC family response regulator